MPNQMSQYLFTVLSIILLSNQSFGQNWKAIDESSISTVRENRQIIPDVYTTYSVDIEHFKKMLESGQGDHRNNVEIALPVGGDDIQLFSVFRADVFHPDLAKRYPQIRAYTGFNISNPNQIVKISISHLGMNAMFLGGDRPQSYIDTYAKNDDTHYISYLKSDYPKMARHEFTCNIEQADDDHKKSNSELRYGDCTLRTYRLAMACTGEYATFHGGTVESVLAEFNTAINRVNGIYERDAAITMQLIANTDELIFFDGATDPYDNESGSTMLGQNQNVINQTIGAANYDIGHVFSTGGGGIASLRSPCIDNRKARGVTGLTSPINDPFYVDYVAHEIGHQFGGNHCYNNSCNNNRNDGTAVEPGSGATIMAYAGICDPNVQNRSDDYFHTISIEEITNFIVAGNGGCAEQTILNNTAPIVETEYQDVVIPARTPFALSASAIDVDNDELTYTWEQMDAEIANMPPESNATGGPLFRSYDPSTSPVRFFPRMSNILNESNGNTWEVLPEVDRNMAFRVTVRDNAINGGCTDYSDVFVSVIGDTGPFEVTEPTNSTLWNSGGTGLINWEVAGTDLAPISCEIVDIYLATDDNKMFDMPLATNVPNTGSYEINVPSINTNNARVMVKCATNIFFDVNAGDFAIVSPFSTLIDNQDIVLCAGESTPLVLSYMPNNGFSEETTFTTNNVPEGMMVSLDNETVTDATDIQIEISTDQSLEAGIYQIEINGNSETASSKDIITVHIAKSSNQILENKLPLLGSRGVNLVTQLTWDNVAGNQGYQVQVSLDAGFNDLIVDKTTISNSYLLNGLQIETVYYWRVAVISPCFELTYLDFQSFQTGGLNCETNTSTEEIIITEEDDNNITSVLEIDDNTIIGLINVGINVSHSYVGDLTANITSPLGQVIDLFDRPGVPESNFGCGANNMEVIFSDNSERTYDQFEMTCDQGTGLAISGEFQPMRPLASFAGENAQGLWTLGMTDHYDPDGGILHSWYIEVCQSGDVDPGVVLVNTGLQLTDVSNKLIGISNINVETLDNSNTIFMVKQTPSNGALQILDSDQGGFVTLEIGHAFTQEDIINNKIRYQFEGNEDSVDELVFDIVDDRNRWIIDERFTINIQIGVLSVSSVVTSPISCTGDSNAEIQLMAAGGIIPYTYSLNAVDYQSSNVFADLSAGMYTGYVKDNTGAVSEIEFVIPEPDPIIASVDIEREEVTVIASGGTGILQFSIDNNLFQSENIFLLSNQTDYIITVKDENDCSVQLPIRIDYIEDFSLLVTDVTCNNEASGTIEFHNLVGGVQPYTYTLDPGDSQQEPIFENLHSGVFTTSVIDANGVAVSKQVTIDQPSPYNVSIDTLGSTAEINVIGNTSPYTYKLVGGVEQEENIFIDLPNGIYTVIITDVNGCQTTIDFVIENSTVSTKIVLKNKIKTFPNPVVEKLTINSSKDYDFDRVQIFDVRGLKVYDDKYTNIIDVSNYMDGVYIVKLFNKKEVGTTRFLKKSGK